MQTKNKIQRTYSVVIPVYQSEKTLSALLDRVSCQMNEIGETYEIILVDDGSNDNSWGVMCSLLDQYKQLRVIRLIRNFGQHNALMCGLSYSEGEMVITLDDDLQNPPEEIPKLIEKIAEGFDVVYGVPVQKKHHPLRNIGTFLVRTAYKKIFNSSIDPSSFRLVRRNVVDGMLSYTKNFTFIDGLIAWYTTSIGQVDVHHIARGAGRSGYSIRKLFSLSMNMLTNFSLIPLQVVSGMGILFSFVGFLLSMLYLVKYLTWGIPVAGYTSIIICVTIFSGVQMLALGIIGEYLGRVHLNVNSKPQYFVRDIFGGEAITENRCIRR